MRSRATRDLTRPLTRSVGSSILLWTASFSYEIGFIQACREFVNRNAACSTSSSKSPELLAKFADGLLKKSNKSGEDFDLETSLNQTVRVGSICPCVIRALKR
jgi:hypothetical protein